LHSHVDEDHVFIIMQGSARFFGPEGETVELGANQGMMMPRGMFYRFHATSTENCLVMLRVGTPNFQKQAKEDRMGMDGKPLVGDSKKNRTQQVVFKDGAFFGD
jgi:mannose-6-phosphate isomerase-like protein (cupin superfamily)